MSLNTNAPKHNQHKLIIRYTVPCTSFINALKANYVIHFYSITPRKAE